MLHFGDKNMFFAFYGQYFELFISNHAHVFSSDQAKFEALRNNIDILKAPWSESLWEFLKIFLSSYLRYGNSVHVIFSVLWSRGLT